MHDKTWFDLLRTGRTRLGLSRKDVARAARFSVDTICSYEFGRRGPTRETLEAIIGVLDLERNEVSQILRSAGFSAAPAKQQIDEDRLRRFGEEVPWPQTIDTEDLYTVYANSLLNKLMHGHGFPNFEGPARHVFVGMAHRDKMQSIANWEEVVGASIALWKDAVGDELPKECWWWPDLTQRLSELDVPELRRFYELWDRTPPLSAQIRSDCIMVWRDAELGEMRFRIVNSGSKQYPDLLIHDLCPIDADTWRKLDLVRER